jgi:hypothetical protein
VGKRSRLHLDDRYTLYSIYARAATVLLFMRCPSVHYQASSGRNDPEVAVQHHIINHVDDQGVEAVSPHPLG